LDGNNFQRNDLTDPSCRPRITRRYERTFFSIKRFAVPLVCGDGSKPEGHSAVYIKVPFTLNVGIRNYCFQFCCYNFHMDLIWLSNY